MNKLEGLTITDININYKVMIDKILDYVLIIISSLVFLSFKMEYDKKRMTPEKFHEMVTNKEEVKRFKEKFPCIVENKYVYICYLMKYYRLNSNELAEDIAKIMETK